MAVGPNVIVEAVNTAICITDKSGNILMPPEEISNFLGAVFGPGDFVGDPYVVYDDQAQRFYFGVVEERFSPNFADFGLYDFAVSNTANPTQASDWTVFRKITSVARNGTEFPDFPKMGWNADAVFVSFNWFDANFGDFTDNLVLTIDKNSILHPGFGLNPGLTTYQTEVNTGSDHKILIPARMHGGPANLEYFVQSADDGKTVNVVTETNYLSANPTFTSTPIAVNPYTDSPGVPELTYQIDDRMLSADWINNRLVAAQDVGLTDGLNHARWYEFDTSSATPMLIQQGDVSPGAGVSTSYPSIALDPAGDIGLTYVQSASDTDGNVLQTPSMYIAAWAVGDPLNALEPSVLVEPGVAGAFPGFRGGDYSATEFDPTDGSFWSAQEYTADAYSTDDWGTYLANYTVTFGPLIASVGPTTTPEGSASVTLTVDGSSFTSTYFVQWDGTSLATHFVSATRLTATVPGSLLTEDGAFPVTVVDSSWPAAQATSNPVDFTVTEPPLKPGVALRLGKAQAGTLFSGVVATFLDPDLTKPLDNYAATIDWGDTTTPTTGTVTALGPGWYQVTAGHTYTVPGRHAVVVTITDGGLDPVTVTDPVQVVGSVLTGTGLALTAVPQKAFHGVVATFTDSDPTHPAAAYTATISWGDGTASSTGTVKALGKGKFTVTGKHAYAATGSDGIVVTLQRGKLAHGTADSTVVVAAAPPGGKSVAAARPAAIRSLSAATGGPARAAERAGDGLLSPGRGTAQPVGSLPPAALLEEWMNRDVSAVLTARFGAGTVRWMKSRDWLLAQHAALQIVLP